MVTPRAAGLYVALLAAIGLLLIAGMASLARESGPMTDPFLTTADPRYAAPAAAVAVRPQQPGDGSDATLLVDPGWVDEVATSTGLPERAVRAYGEATLRLGREQPACGLGWTTLAGIGEVESHHGTIGGRALRADGRSSTPILGPALDGREGFKAIPATPESTVWHGNPRWDHAVGPLQFIPTTWSQWGSDGDRDGSSDPNDIDDAAYAAARYLCADGHRLDSDDWGRAIFSYNRSNDYVRSVHAAAIHYASRTGS